jgi:hypothetical protein
VIARSVLVRQQAPARPSPVRLVPHADPAAQLEREAAALVRLSAATRALAHARAEAAELGLAQWCEACDRPMSPDRKSNVCPRCVKAAWTRVDRAAARITTPAEE